MPRVGFEPTISAGERPKTYALDRAAIGTGHSKTLPTLNKVIIKDAVNYTVHLVYSLSLSLVRMKVRDSDILA